MLKKMQHYYIMLTVFLLAACSIVTEGSTVTESIDEGNELYPGIKIKSEIKRDKDYHYAVHYPLTDSQEINDEIKTYIDTRVTKFMIDMAEDKLGEPVVGLHIDFEITYFTPDYFSVEFSETLFVDEAMTNMIPFNFNRVENRKIELQELFVGEEEITIVEPNDEHEIVDFLVKEPVIRFYEKNGEIIDLPKAQLVGQLQPEFLSGYEKKEKKTKENKGTKEEKMEKGKEEKQKANQKRIALTYDDGPHHLYTLQILEELEKYGAHATFFVLGNRAEFHPDIVLETMEAGHEIGNHSWSHPKFSGLSKKQIVNQIEKTQDVVHSITGEYPTFVRTPYGSMSDSILNAINMPVVLWSVDPKDWKVSSSKAVIDNVLNNVEDGSIILLHDTYEHTVSATATIVETLSEEGYEFVTVTELLGLDEEESQRAMVINSGTPK